MKIVDFKISFLAESEDEAWENLTELFRAASPEFFSVENRRADGTKKTYIESSTGKTEESKPEKGKGVSKSEAEKILSGFSDILCKNIRSFSSDKDVQEFISAFLHPFFKTKKTETNEKV